MPRSCWAGGSPGGPRDRRVRGRRARSGARCILSRLDERSERTGLGWDADTACPRMQAAASRRNVLVAVRPGGRRIVGAMVRSRCGHAVRARMGMHRQRRSALCTAARHRLFDAAFRVVVSHQRSRGDVLSIRRLRRVCFVSGSSTKGTLCQACTRRWFWEHPDRSAMR